MTDTERKPEGGTFSDYHDEDTNDYGVVYSDVEDEYGTVIIRLE